MITAIICSVIAGLLVGTIIGGVIGSNEPYHCSHWDYEAKSMKVADLEMRIFHLEREKDRLNHVYRSIEMKKRCFEEHYAAHCISCHKTFYSKDQKDEDLAKMLTDITLNSKEIAHKLGFEIK